MISSPGGGRQLTYADYHPGGPGALPLRLRSDATDGAIVSSVTARVPQGPDKFATIFSQEAKRLLAMDRYERLALFRRKIAILAFDEARRYFDDAVRVG